MTSGQETERIYFYNSGAHMGVCDSAWTSVVLIGLELCLSILTAIFPGVQHPARKRSRSILTTPQPARGHDNNEWRHSHQL